MNDRLSSDHSVLNKNYEKDRTELSKHREKKTIRKTETVRNESVLLLSQNGRNEILKGANTCTYRF